VSFFENFRFLCHIHQSGSRGNSVSIENRLRAGRPGFNDGIFSLLHRILISLRANPASYPMGTGGSSPWVKQAGCEADHSSLPGAEVKNVRSYTSTPQYVFMEWCLVKPRDKYLAATTFTNPHLHYQAPFETVIPKDSLLTPPPLFL
jgi:hypothetical protein